MLTRYVPSGEVDSIGNETVGGVVTGSMEGISPISVVGKLIPVLRVEAGWLFRVAV